MSLAVDVVEKIVAQLKTQQVSRCFSCYVTLFPSRFLPSSLPPSPSVSLTLPDPPPSPPTPTPPPQRQGGTGKTATGGQTRVNIRNTGQTQQKQQCCA